MAHGPWGGSCESGAKDHRRGRASQCVVLRIGNHTDDFVDSRWVVGLRAGTKFLGENRTTLEKAADEGRIDDRDVWGILRIRHRQITPLNDIWSGALLICIRVLGALQRSR